MSSLNRKYNYNSVNKLLIGVIISQTILIFLIILFIGMFYRVNFNNVNNNNNSQTNNQVVHIDNRPKFDKIDINNCSYEALDNLEGIGEVRANKIIAGRPHKDIFQIKKIVGEKTFDKIKNNIKVGGTDE